MEAVASVTIGPPPAAVLSEQSGFGEHLADASQRPLAGPLRISLSPDDRVADAALTALSRGVAALTFYESAAIAGDVEALHQLRVATRRLRAAVELFAGVIHGSRVRIYRRDLPWVGRTAAVVRDCDVIEALIRNRAAKLDVSLGKSLAQICEALSTRRRAEHARVIEMAGSPRYRRLVARLTQPLIRKVPANVTLRMVGPVAIRPIARAVTRAGMQLAADSPDKTFHSLRIRIKRLRYALEMLEGLSAKRTQKALRRLRDLQDLLGQRQDAVGAIGWLREFAATDGSSPQALLAAGALIQSLIRRRDKLGGRCYRGWKRFNRTAIMRDALAEIAHNSRERPPDQIQVAEA